jgi:hypothetical protein
MAMKIQKKKNKKEIFTIALAACVGLLILIGGSVYAYSKIYESNTPSTPTQSVSDDEQNKNIENDPSVKQTTPNTDTPLAAATNGSTGKKIAQMVSSSNISNGYVYIRGGINNLVVEDGTCSAMLTSPTGETSQKITTLLQSAATTDCKTISMSTSSLEKGTWKFTLNYSSNTAEGKTDENTFTIK